MAVLPQFWFAVALGIASIVVLRLSWSRPSRSTSLNAVGWSGIVLSVVLASLTYGAWGVAVASLFPMAAALLLLLPSIASQPRWKRKPVDRTTSERLPERPEPVLGRRIASFMIVSPAALLAAVMAALALRVLFLSFGGAEADANVIVLACVPVVWAIFSTALLMMESRGTQAALLAAITVPSVLTSILIG
ncbi:hypothetical protein CP97_12645 [Aurantiacibacter atlanticus]|uniref:Uncharacterized protein n=1 Tax=Aurantiacibacter atlanticus TaxID=1648404 RepID=A0A0H4VZV1_9SPHN|nr:hypothetical protein [Aurantiacibacter atlanticus]AKQ42703.1 hypothetical protein CP97_12645 [Aurantiacibacter atlanticus]MDF1834438.1 hypothetical protein [Alteraurantiacibacter sp. bin_em_oilr2.035]